MPFVQSGSQVFISGQVSISADGLVKGTLGSDMDVAAGQAAARLCAINLIAQLKSACGGDLSRVKRVVKLGGFVAAVPGFTDHPLLTNGSSDPMVAAFGDDLSQAPSAVTCAVLSPGLAAVCSG